MRRLMIVALIAVSAASFTGCSALGGAEPVATVEPTVEPIEAPNDPDAWDQPVTLEQFEDAFPEFDASGLVSMPNVNVMNNTRMWVLGSSDRDHSYEKAVSWAKGYVDLKPEGDDRTVSGIYVGKTRNVSIMIVQAGDDVDTAGFWMYITSSI
ncbi:hypothetical protein [Agreia pratensis]|nr:hypothetical protein [Agreia pratensis]